MGKATQEQQRLEKGAAWEDSDGEDQKYVHVSKLQHRLVPTVKHGNVINMSLLDAQRSGMSSCFIWRFFRWFDWNVCCR